MTTAPALPAFPTRFREGEARAAAMGRGLRLVARVGGLDEELMARLGRGFMEYDEPGVRLAEAIRTRAVTRKQLADALAGGVAEHPALAALVRDMSTVPDWVDWDLVEEGAAVSRRLGQNAADVLLQLSLIGGYRFGGPTDLLAATGALTGDGTKRRLAETQAWTVAVAQPGAMRPGGDGWKQTVQVRLMHAMVNATFADRWDAARWGRPISQTDLASTLALFDATLLLGARGLGARITRREAAALLHLWKWIGHLLGVDPDLLVDGEREKYRLMYHIVRAQAGLTSAGPLLSQAVVEAQRQRHYAGWPGPLQRLRARYEVERLLSMLTVFLGPASMRELGLGIRPPWAFAYLWPVNTFRYRVLARLPGGRRRLEQWGDRVSDRILASYEAPASVEL